MHVEEVYILYFMASEDLTYTPMVLPMPGNTSSNQNSRDREYNLIHTGACMKSSVSWLNLSVQNLKKRPVELKKYDPPSNIRFLSSKLCRIMVKNPLEPSCRSYFPLGFHY
jgi:hypothetical protein